MRRSKSFNSFLFGTINRRKRNGHLSVAAPARVSTETGDRVTFIPREQKEEYSPVPCLHQSISNRQETLAQWIIRIQLLLSFSMIIPKIETSEDN